MGVLLLICGAAPFLAPGATIDSLAPHTETSDYLMEYIVCVCVDDVYLCSIAHAFHVCAF